jgi:hypothetical protein
MTRTLRKMAAMNGAELRFRATCRIRTAADRLRVAIAPPRWPASNHPTAHRQLAARIAARSIAFPFDSATLPARVSLIRSRFPLAAREAAERADRLLDGYHDLLGYCDVAVGVPPSWHADAIHGRTAPLGFWADVPFLDPACGDHKVIWELNRHQHWLALARAFQLTGNRRYYVEFVAQLESWLAANPPLTGINWASMLELAFRSLSWLWALHAFAPAVAGDPPGAPTWTIRLLTALDRQLDHILQNLSRYFSPNTHLMGEALALYIGGLALPELTASRRRVDVGRAVLLAEADRQIRADGGHAEQSAHYHRYSTDFYLLALAVARSAGDAAAPRFERAARQQSDYLRTIADDEGRLPLLGDDDGGTLFPICRRDPADCRDTLATSAVLLASPELAVGQAPEETFWLCGEAAAGLRYAPPRPWPSRHLAESGYIVLRTPAGDHLTFDAGRHGYLNGGHAHADALSLVLTVQGRPLLVDAGTATYTMNAAVRDRFRSTSMHNTVVIGGRSQSEPDGPFHWRSTTDAAPSLWQTTAKADYAEARHSAYAPLVHVRQVLAVPAFGWFVIDHILGDEAFSGDAMWHVHPNWEPHQRRRGWLFQSGDRVVGMAASAPLRPVSDRTLATYAPVYGRVVEAPCLTAALPARAPSSVVTIIAAEPAVARDLSIESLVVTVPAPAGWHGAVFRLRAAGRSGFLFASVERSGRPAAEDARPGQAWGVSGATTDARVAVALMGSSDPILINGTTVQVSQHVASSVQEPAARTVAVP